MSSPGYSSPRTKNPPPVYVLMEISMKCLSTKIAQAQKSELISSGRMCFKDKSSFKKNMNHERQTPLSTDAVSGTSHGKPDPRHHPSQVGIFTHLILKRYSSARWCGFATVALPAPGPLGRRLRSQPSGRLAHRPGPRWQSSSPLPRPRCRGRATHSWRQALGHFSLLYKGEEVASASPAFYLGQCDHYNRAVRMSSQEFPDKKMKFY